MPTHTFYPLTQLLTLLSKAVGCRKAGLFFIGDDSEDYITRIVAPDDGDEMLSTVLMKEHSPVIEYLKQEQKTLTREKLVLLTEVHQLSKSEKKEIESTGLELVVPLINHDRLVGILAIGEKQNGGYTLEDYGVLEDFVSHVAVGIEKEFYPAQPAGYQEELSVITSASTILTSSLDIPAVYDDFIAHLKKITDICWSAIALIEENELHFIALYSEIDSPWHLGERIPLRDTATELVAASVQTVLEPDLSVESRFVSGEHYLKQRVRSIASLPLIVGDEVIGSFIVASQHPDAYSRWTIDILEKLASRIAIPVTNSLLYASVQQMARVDELTSLLNRRSLDEIIDSEVNRHSRYGGVLSLIILDLDSMKTVNDKHGHLAGDKLLGRVGSILKKTIRKVDYGFRYGGDEFAVLLPQTSIDAAMHVAERIRMQIASGTKGTIPSTASLGLASWPADGLTSNEVIAAADTALYRAKRSGGNRILRYQPDSLISNYTTVTAQSSDDSEALTTIYFMAAAVDARDRYTGDHSRKVNEYAKALGKALNLQTQEIDRISACALLHDIGKVGISDEILNKTGELTEEEWEIIKSHPNLGATMAAHVHKLAPYIPGILYHHERYDGGGYPEGLVGEEIPLEARIIAIADAFAAMTSTRNYSAALSYEEAVEEIKRGVGTQFDPVLVKVFLSIVGEVSSAQGIVTGARSAKSNATPVASGGLK